MQRYVKKLVDVVDDMDGQSPEARAILDVIDPVPVAIEPAAEDEDAAAGVGSPSTSASPVPYGPSLDGSLRVWAKWGLWFVVHVF